MTLPTGVTKHHTFDEDGACVEVRYEDGKGNYMEGHVPIAEPLPDRFYKRNGRDGQVVSAGQIAADAKEFRSIQEIAAALMRAGYR